MMLDAKFRQPGNLENSWKDRTMSLIGKLAFSEIQFHQKTLGE